MALVRDGALRAYARTCNLRVMVCACILAHVCMWVRARVCALSGRTYRLVPG